MEKTIKINSKDILVKEVKYKDFITISIQGLTQDIVAKKLAQLSTGLSDLEYDDLSLKDGISLMQTVNEVNGLVQNSENFQQK